MPLLLVQIDPFVRLLDPTMRKWCFIMVHHFDSTQRHGIIPSLSTMLHFLQMERVLFLWVRMPKYSSTMAKPGRKRGSWTPRTVIQGVSLLSVGINQVRISSLQVQIEL